MFGGLKNRKAGGAAAATPAAPAKPPLSLGDVFSSQPVVSSFPDAQEDPVSPPRPVAESESDDDDKGSSSPPLPQAPQFAFSSSEDEMEEEAKKTRTAAKKTPRYSMGNVKLRLKSSTLSTRDLRRANKQQNQLKQRVKIENLGDQGFRVHLYLCRTTRHPVLFKMDDARDVLEWYTQTRYIGVRPLPEDEGFACYLVFEGRVAHMERYQFTTAELAARKHDELARENGVPYHKNFRMVRVARTDIKRKLRRASDFRYHASIKSRIPFGDENVWLMRKLIARMSVARGEDAGELWLALQQAVAFACNWNANQAKLRADVHVTLMRLAQVSKLLHQTWRVGDSLLQREGNVGKRRIARNRLQWSRGVFEVVIGLREEMKARRSTNDRMRQIFAWSVAQCLLLEFNLLLSDGEGGEEMDAFRIKLERYDEMKHWKHEAAFQHLLGLVVRATCQSTDEEQLKLAQKHFAAAIELHKLYKPSLAALAAVEIDIQKLHESTMGNIQTLSQRSAASSQQSHNPHLLSSSSSSSSSPESSEDDERGNGAKKRRRTLGRQSLAPAATVHVDALDVLDQVAKDHALFPPLLDAWDALLFHDGVNAHETDEDVMEAQRQSILKWIAVDGTLQGGAVRKTELLWRLCQPHTTTRSLLARCFGGVADCVERLTQKECPTYTTHFSPQSIPLWELLVCILQLLPEDTVQFAPERKQLWRARYFPGLIDPFQFTGKHCVDKRQKLLDIGNCARDQYLHALKAVVAHMCLIAPEFHLEAVTRLGGDFVNSQAVDQACRACGLIEQSG